MPIYEYRCRSCGEEFEMLIRSVNRRGEVPCPKCEGSDVERKLSVFAAPSVAQPACDSPSPSACAGCQQPDGACPFGSGGST